MSGYQDVPMTRRRAQLLEEYASKLADMLEAAPNDKDLAEWIQSKIDRAAAAIQSAYHYLDQELEKAVGHKYTHRKLTSRDPKTGRARYRYYYAEHQGGGISRAKFEAGSAFKLTWKGRRGHFHIQRVEGDKVFITHDSRPNMAPVPVQADELRALLKKQHSKAEQKHVQKRKRKVEEIKRRPHKGGLGLALHRLRQAAAQAGVSLPEQYQRKPKKTRAPVAETAREVETPREQLKDTAQQIIEDANQEHEERHDEHQEITRFELGEHTHTKTGAKLYTAKQTERVDRDEYFRRVEIAKKYKGRYERRYVRGFVFKNAEDARAFALEVEGAAQEAPETSAETVTPHEDHPSADNFETMPEVESAGTPKALLDDIRSEITVERFIREGRRREDTAEREVKKLLGDLEKLEQGLLDREYSTEAKRAKAQEILNRRLPKILEQVRHLVSAKLVNPQLSGGAGKRNAARYHRALGDIGIAEDRANEEYRRALKELDQLEKKQIPTPSPVQSEVLEAVNQSQAFINDLIFNKQGKLTRARNRNKLKGYSDNGARSVAGDIVSETMREVSPHLMNHTNRQRYESQAYVNVARVLSESKGLTREEIAVSIETVLREAAQKTDVLNPPTEMILPKRTGEISEFGERLADRETVEIDVSPTPTTPREQLTETAREVTQGADNFETMPEVEAPAREQLIETAEQATAPSSPLDIDQANAQDSLTENRTRAPESKAADKALIESARELAKTSERGEEIKSALVDLMNAQQLKRYKRATGDTRARAEDMIEKRREARERLRAATSGEAINNFETMPEVEAQPKRGPSTYTRAGMVSYSKVDSIMEGKTPSRLPLKTQAQFEKIESLITELEQMEQQRTKSGRLKDWQGIKAKREEILNARRVLLQKYASERTRTQHSALQDHTFLSYYKPSKSTATPEDVRDKHGDRRSDLRTLRRYFETHEPDQQGQLTEAAETLDTRSTQQKTFTPEIQSAIESLKSRHFATRGKSYPLETYLKTRKDGGIYRTTETPAKLADRIAENLPENIASEDYNIYDFREDTLRTLITKAINEGVEARETPAELKDRIGSVITQRAQDNAASQKAQITGEGQRKALLEMKRNIKTLSGDGYFDEYRRRGERSYMGLGAIEKTLSMSERLSNLYVDAIFREALPPELERFKMPITRFSTKAADEVAGAFANKYETVGEIRDNISTIREQMRATIKSALDETANALVKRPATLDLINQSYEKATERLNTDRQKNIENARALAQYTDDPQAHLAEIQELERQSDQAIAEQMGINREFADAYIHEASDLVERAIETTKGEVIDNVMSVKTPKHAGKFTASGQGKANRKLIARIFNEVFEQVTREIRDEPIERGEKHPRNIADTVKKPSKTPAQFRGNIERADKEKKERARAEREARRARRVQKSARHLITYRAQLVQTVERLTAA